MLDFHGDRENHEKHLGESSSFSLPRAAIEIFSSIKASIFQTFGVTSPAGAVSLVPTFEEGNQSEFLDKQEVSETCDLCAESHPMSDLLSTENTAPGQEVIEIYERKDLPSSLDNNTSGRFKQFDIIDNCSDHHFFDERKGSALSQVKN